MRQVTRPYQSIHLPTKGPFVLAVLGGAVSGLLAVTTGPTAILALFVGILVALVTSFAPGLLFAGYLLIPAFYKGALQPYSPVDITVVLALLNALQIIPVALDRRRRHVSNAGILLWILLAFLILAGALYAPDQPLALTKVATWWALAFLPILPAAMRVGSDPRYLSQFAWSLFGLGVPMVVLGLTQLSSTQRLALLGVDTIAVSRAALLVPLLGITFVLRQRLRMLRFLAIILIPAAFLVALASGSRGPLLILLVLGLLAIVRYITRPRSVNLRLTGLIAGLALMCILVLSFAASRVSDVSLQRFTMFGEFVQSTLSGELSTSVGDTSSGTRVELFRVAVALFDEQPVFGVGPGGFETLVPRILGPAERETYPHNAFLQIAAELGIVGVGVFVLLVGLALVRRLPSERSSPAVRAAFLYFLLNAMLSRGIYEDRTMWGLLMLVLLVDSPPTRAGRQLIGGFSRVALDLVPSSWHRESSVGVGSG